MLALIGMVVCAAEVPVSLEVQLSEGSRPSVFLTAEEVAAFRSRAESLDWATAVAGKILSQAEGLLEMDLDVPQTGGQWSHWYTCKKDGGRLKAQSPTEHVCAVCGEV